MTRAPLLSAVAVLALTISGCNAAPASESTPTPAAPAVAAPDPVAVRASLETIEKQYSAAFLKSDADGIAALYSEDAADIPLSGEWIRGRAAIAKSNHDIFDANNIATREDITEEVTVSGDYAFEIGHYSWTGTAKKGGAKKSEAGRYVVVWHKDADGTWRLLRDMGAAAPAKM